MVMLQSKTCPRAIKVLLSTLDVTHVIRWTRPSSRERGRPGNEAKFDIHKKAMCGCKIIGSKFPLDNGMIHVFDSAILYLSPFLVGCVQAKG